ncbi:hypothetical protein AAF712_008289 [Marasmius tenuissimus]|uniref:MARVEL domain-containing protein n=1 Tax=Marasmius tenuissimus TaxID=585030 RepID=A0ABR2ZVE4_9AGAR
MSLPKVLPVLRLVTFGTTLVFATVLLGLNAHLTYWTEKYIGGYFRFAALSIASACLTLITLPIMIAVDMTRNAAVSSMIAFELVWLGILWTLWLASAARAADTNRLVFPDGCDSDNSFEDTLCREFAAVVAFNFLTWFAFFAYTAVVLAASIIVKSRGTAKVWTASVADISKNLGGEKSDGPEKPPLEPPVFIPQQPSGITHQDEDVGTSLYQHPSQRAHNAGFVR